MSHIKKKKIIIFHQLALEFGDEYITGKRPAPGRLACLLALLSGIGEMYPRQWLGPKRHLWNRSLQLLAYADDIDIIGRSEKAVKEAFQALEISATNMGLTINEDKTKFMETLPSFVNNTSFCVNGHSFERKQLRSKFISGKTKLRLYKTLILPVLLYARETWTLNLETIRALETFERKALRTIFGPVKDQGCWRTRYNFELYRLYKESKVTQVIRSNRLRWLGNIWREALKTTRSEFTHLRILCDLEQEEDYQQGGQMMLKMT
ncbi:reverse transcriptase domain-containing protein [Trichonephila clavipes]|nr:reverse transcriptase domain-containing protein [Trichonephila clavipes]